MNTNNEPFNLDTCIEQLRKCHPLKECQVKALCDKVSIIISNNNQISGERNFQTRKQRSASQSSSNSVW